MIALTTQRLRLRKPSAADWPAFQTFAMSDRSKGIGGPYSHRHAWRRFAAEVGHWDILGYGMFTVTQIGDDTPLGLVGPWFPDGWPEREIGWIIYEHAEGKSIAYEAAQACIRHAFDTLGWATAVSYIDENNHRSRALATRLGAIHDPAAAVPYPQNPCMVYRHPKRETA